MTDKTDHRIKGGLNNQKHPLRKVIEIRNRFHVLDCGHVLQQIGTNWVRARRCYKCSEIESKDKKMNEKIESAKRKAAAIEFITGAAVDFPVVICIGNARTGENEYQIMPENEFAAGEIVERFWDWHTENNEQWFESPLEAAADFVAKYTDFCKPKNLTKVFKK